MKDDITKILDGIETRLMRDSYGSIEKGALWIRRDDVVAALLKWQAGQAAPVATQLASTLCTCANNPLNSWPNLEHDKNCPAGKEK